MIGPEAEALKGFLETAVSDPVANGHDHYEELPRSPLFAFHH
jgi:hypothetical protein